MTPMNPACAALALLLAACVPTGPGANPAPCDWYRDADSDGFGDPSQVQEHACDDPLPGWTLAPGDCDDDLAEVRPGAAEVCDDLDDDCDGFVDDQDPDLTGAPVWYPDLDRDGWGEEAAATSACEAPDGWIAAGGDCDDGDPLVNPSGVERCDGTDQDCDGLVDDDAADAPTWYADADADSFGDPRAAVRACERPDGTVPNADDCDDADPAANPAATELCDGDDDDCDGVIDEDDALDAPTWYADADGDSFGDPAVTTRACTRPADFVADATDCDDARADVNPAAAELCNGVDDDCSGAIDEPTALDAPTWYADADGDSFGDPGATAQACTQPAGFVADATDCDDARADVNPAAVELCNGVDDDCSGVIDEPTALDAPTWYADADGDSFGDPASATRACTQPSGLIAEPGDCADADASIHPGAAETCDGVDQDCDGVVDEGTGCYDDDGDGFSEDDGDCDDADAATGPAATEGCDGVDNDCDGLVDDDDPSLAGAPRWYLDADLDGYGDPTAWADACAEPSGYLADASDCDDGDADVNPAASEACDGVDQDCDGSVDDSAGCPCAVQTWGGHGYLFCASFQMWYTANGRYDDYGYELVTVGSAAEQAWLVSAAATYSTSACWWLGYNDQSSEDSWVWASGEVPTYESWDSGQPDDGSWSEDCAEFVASGSGMWNDEQCWSSCYAIHESL